MLKIMSSSIGRFSSFLFLLFILSISLIGRADVVKADTIVVEMRGGPGDGDFRFSPADVTIRVGDTIQWINMSPSGIVHTATSGMGSGDPMNAFFFDTGFLSSGESFLVQFDRMGTFNYYCIPHEFFGMTGVIRVGAIHREATPGTF